MINSIPNSEILRYLGYYGSEADSKTLAKIERLKAGLLCQIKPKYTYAPFYIKKTPECIQVQDTALVLRGESIRHFLEHADEIVLMAATLGIETDRFLLQTQKTSLTDGVIADAIASAAIEELCDAVQIQITEKYPVTQRFSCGYGDLPLNIQPDILAVLNTQKTIGLYCNQNHIMIPRKSVTAILGVTTETQGTDPCEYCQLKEKCKAQKSCVKHRKS